MAVRVYRAPAGPRPAVVEPHQEGARTGRARAPGRSFASQAASDVFEEPQADSHIAERKAKKENRAGRRELEAARRQQRELREDQDYEVEEG